MIPQPSNRAEQWEDKQHVKAPLREWYGMGTKATKNHLDSVKTVKMGDKIPNNVPAIIFFTILPWPLPVERSPHSTVCQKRSPVVFQIVIEIPKIV